MGEGVDKVYRGLDELLAENGTGGGDNLWWTKMPTQREYCAVLYMGLCILLLSRLAHISRGAVADVPVMPTSVSTILFTDIGGGFAQTHLLGGGHKPRAIGLTYR